jgi:hypothetical protein
LLSNLTSRSSTLLAPLSRRLKVKLEVLLTRQYTGLLKSVIPSRDTIPRLRDGNKGNWPEHTYIEVDWNPMVYERVGRKGASRVIAYYASKALTGRVAWDFAQDHKPTFNPSNICPSLVSLDKFSTSSADIYHPVVALGRPLTHPLFLCCTS